jgi:HAE1 family hydrophobic/amphiphilic exporter-1
MYGRVSRALGAFNRWFERQADRYKGVVAWALDHRLAMFAIAVLSFGGAILLQATMGGAGFVPVSDRSEVNLTVEAPPGSARVHAPQGG